jgi:hypothetical protein
VTNWRPGDWLFRRRGDLAAAGLLFGVTVATWAVFPIAGRELLFGPDATEQTWTWWRFNIAEFQAGRIPLWNPFVSAGMSNIGEGQMGALYPPTAIVAFLGGAAASSMLALIVVSAAHFALSACGAYLVVRVAGLQPASATAAALVVALSGAMLWRSTGQLNIYWAMCWVPLAIALCWAALRFGQLRWAPFAGAAFALSLAAGHAQGVVIGAVVVAVTSIVLLIPAGGTRRPGIPVGRSLFAGLVVVGSFALLALPQLWAEISYLRDAYRWVGATEPVRGFGGVSYEAIAANSHLSWSGMFSSFLSTISTADGSIFIGLPAIVLAIFGLVSFGHHRRLRVLGSALVILGVLVALGPRTPFLLIWSQIPLVSQVRQPIRFDVVIVLGVSLLVAVGCQTWFAHERRRWIALAAVGGAAVVAVMLANGSDVQTLLTVGLLVVAVPAVLLLPRQRQAVLSATAAVAVVVTLLCTWWLRLPPVGTQSQTPATWFSATVEDAGDSLVGLAGEDAPSGRVRVAESLPRNFGTFERIATVSGYSATLPARYFDLMVAFGFDDRVWDLLAVEALVESIDGRAVVTHRETALPLAWYAESTRVVPEDTPGAVAGSGVDLKSVAVLAAPDSSSDYCDGAASVIARTPGGIDYDVACERGGLLVLSEIWDPAWRAYVDGSPVSIARVDYSLMGVRTPPGAARVELRYEPRSIAVGLPLAIGAAILVTALAVLVILVGRRPIAQRSRDRFKAALGARASALAGRVSPVVSGLIHRISSPKAALWIVVSSSAFALAGGIALVPTVGLQYDEVLFVNGSTDATTTHFVNVRFGGIPILLMDYIGALKAWLYAPIFAVFGAGMESVRIPMIFAFVLSVAILVRIVWVRSRPWVAALLGILLLLEPAFTLMARNDWGPVALGGLLRVGLVGALLIAIESGRRRWAFAATLLLALGIFNKLDFAISGTAILAAVLVVFARSILAAIRRRPISASVIFAAFVAVYLAAYFFMYLRAAGSVGSFSGTWLERVESRANLITDTFEGGMLVRYMTGETLSAPSPAIPVALGVALVVGAAALLSRRGVREATVVEGGRIPIGKLLAMSIVACATTFLGLVLASEVTGPHHAALLWPFPWLVIALGYAYLVERARQEAAVHPLALVGGIFVAIVVVGQAVATTSVSSIMISTTERPAVWTQDTRAASDALAAHLTAQEDAVLVTADWGIANQFIAYDVGADHLDVRDIWPAVVSTTPVGLIETGELPTVFYLAYHTDANQVFAGGTYAARALVAACREGGVGSELIYRGDDLIVRKVEC